MTFKEAFAKADAAGRKTFTWNGKKYTTEKASGSAPKSSPRPKSPKPGARGQAQGRATSDRVAKNITDRKTKADQLKLQGSSPKPKAKSARRKTIESWEASQKKDRLASAPTKASGSSGADGLTFKEAFAKARKAGKKDFKWKGKSYNTKTK